jgi:hypothetical protein
MKEYFPDGVNLVRKDEIKKENSSYHNYFTSGYIRGEKRDKGEIVCDALAISHDDEKVYDPKNLVSDIWGNYHLYDNDGRLIDSTYWQTVYDSDFDFGIADRLCYDKDLTDDEREKLHDLIDKGEHSVRRWRSEPTYVRNEKGEFVEVSPDGKMEIIKDPEILKTFENK